MRTIKIIVGLTVTAELSISPRAVAGLSANEALRELKTEQLLALQDCLVDTLRRAAISAAERAGTSVASYTIQAIETE